MKYISPDLITLLHHLDQLNADMKPLWGTMTPQQMVEHLTDGIKLAYGQISLPVETPEDKIEKMQGFLMSDKPFPREFKASFVPEHIDVRHEELELAIDEFVLEWIEYENYYLENPGATHPHPYYGQLTVEMWDQLQSKHITHHLTQFGIEITDLEE
jgi:oxepin-CoA hydrolase / 3-oxo-5,6-dehydrosuberyl-CoA semialdehyde dehydrogenase